jgi:hypothetical protein
VLKLPSLTHYNLLSLHLALRTTTMGLLSLLPESLQTVETWIIRVFVRQYSFPSNSSSSLTTGPVPARGHNIRPVDSATGLRHHLVHLAICHFRPAADWWPTTAASCSKSQGTPRWTQAESQPSGWSPATCRLPPGRRPCCHHPYYYHLGFRPQTQHHRHHESPDL